MQAQQNSKYATNLMGAARFVDGLEVLGDEGMCLVGGEACYEKAAVEEGRQGFGAARPRGEHDCRVG